MSCPALHILRGTVYDQDPAGRFTPRNPECAIDPATGRCRHCRMSPGAAPKEAS